MIKVAFFLMFLMWRWPVIYEETTTEVQLVADFCGADDDRQSVACLEAQQYYPVWFVAAGKLTFEVGVLAFAWLVYINY